MMPTDECLDIKQTMHTYQYPWLRQAQGIPSGSPTTPRLRVLPAFAYRACAEGAYRAYVLVLARDFGHVRQGLRLGTSASRRARQVRHSFSSSQILLEKASASPLQVCRSLIAAMLDICARGHGLGVHLCFCAFDSARTLPGPSDMCLASIYLDALGSQYLPLGAVD